MRHRMQASLCALRPRPSVSPVVLTRLHATRSRTASSFGRREQLQAGRVASF